MILFELLFCYFAIYVCNADWVGDWMAPVQDQLTQEPLIKNDNYQLPGNSPQISHNSQEIPEGLLVKDKMYKSSGDLSMDNLKLKLETTIQNANTLAETLRVQILALDNKEKTLKEAIVNGRQGVSTLTVSTLNQPPRSYIIHEGRWILCNGMIEHPVPNSVGPTNLFNTLFSEPRCIGREVSAAPDPCVFNSVIKYEVVPTRRSLEYVEEDYLCLKTAFNDTLEQYMSVTNQLVNRTCKDGTVRSLEENQLECGVRILSEYSFYPEKTTEAANLPLEYCTEKDGSCRLLVGWHVSNITIENFEFLRSDDSFKKYFINSGRDSSGIERMI